MRHNVWKRIAALLLLACMLFAFSAETFAATVRVKNLKITNGNVCIRVGESITLKTTITPSNATNKNVTWSTNNKTIATVSSKGVVKGLKAGTVTITATSKDNKKIKATCNITVEPNVPVTGLKIANGYVVLLQGESITLKATVTPSNATNKDVTWSTSDKRVATVSSSGVVKPTGNCVGEVTIKATSKDNNKIIASCTVYVARSCMYRVVKVKDLPATFTKTPIYEVWGKPGDKLSIEKEVDEGRTYSVTAGVSIKKIDAAIGWQKEKTIKIKGSGEWTVPEKVGKKKVKEAAYEVYGKLERVEYKIQCKGYGWYAGDSKWVDWKTGCIAEKLSDMGIKFDHKYIYK